MINIYQNVIGRYVWGIYFLEYRKILLSRENFIFPKVWRRLIIILWPSPVVCIRTIHKHVFKFCIQRFPTYQSRTWWLWEYLKLYLNWIVTDIYASWNWAPKLVINFIIFIFWFLEKGFWKTTAVEVLPDTVLSSKVSIKDLRSRQISCR